MRKHEKKVVLLCILFMLISTVGCWDRIEIENRAFVLGIGLDKTEQPGMIALTYQVALPAAMYGEGGGDAEKVWNIMSTSSTVIRAEKQILTRMDRVPNLEHTKVLVIGEDLAKEGISGYIDFFLRDINMRRRTDVLIVQGKAGDVFEVTPPTAKSTADYVGNIIMENEGEVHRISSQVDLLKMVRILRRQADFTLARIEPGEKDLTISGAGVFKKDQLVGFLGAQDVRKVKWLINDISHGTIEIENVDKFNGKVVFEISEGKSKVLPRIEGEQINFDVNIRVEGDLAEMSDLEFNQTMSKQFIDAFEKKVEGIIKQECEQIMQLAQEKYEADFFDFGGLTRDYNARWFRAHEKQWREVFKKSKLNVNVEVKIRRVGLVE